MDKILVIGFDSEHQAYEGSRALKELHTEGTITVYASAVIAKDDRGLVAVKEAANPGPLGSFVGLLTGGLVGLLLGPLGAAAGVAGGFFIGSMYDFIRAGVRDDFLNEVAEYLQPGRVAVVAEVDEKWVLPVDTLMEAAGGIVFRQPLTDMENIQIEQDLAALSSEIGALKAERDQATEEARAKLQVKINLAKAKLQAKIDHARARDEAAHRVAEAKVQSLERQAVTAAGMTKRWLQDRAAQVRAEYNERSATLRQARELAQEAFAT